VAIKIKLYKSGEIHSNGWPVYRRLILKNKERKRNAKGLAGVYYYFDGDDMMRCGKAYCDEYGCFDGEALWPVPKEDYEIVEVG
tara:strand:+ start:4042 stop:4293 length:252 start_codon:yes stop_codon:yes gene_type:complete